MSDLTQYTTDELDSAKALDVIDDIASESFAIVVKSQGFFVPEKLFTTVNVEAVNRIKAELEYTSEIIGVSLEELMESMPSVAELINQ